MQSRNPMGIIQAELPDLDRYFNDSSAHHSCPVLARFHLAMVAMTTAREIASS